jgi:hypothetical protein
MYMKSTSDFGRTAPDAATASLQFQWNKMLVQNSHVQSNLECDMAGTADKTNTNFVNP